MWELLQKGELSISNIFISGYRQYRLERPISESRQESWVPATTTGFHRAHLGWAELATGPSGFALKFLFCFSANANPASKIKCCFWLTDQNWIKIQPDVLAKEGRDTIHCWRGEIEHSLLRPCFLLFFLIQQKRGLKITVELLFMYLHIYFIYIFKLQK